MALYTPSALQIAYMAKFFPDILYVQVNDIDEGKVYRDVAESKDQLQFSNSDSHPVAVYRLVK